jgi:hypothetical protein
MTANVLSVYMRSTIALTGKKKPAGYAQRAEIHSLGIGGDKPMLLQNDGKESQ